MTAELIGGPHDGHIIPMEYCPQFIETVDAVNGDEIVVASSLYEIEEQQFVDSGRPVKYIFIAPAQIPSDL